MYHLLLTMTWPSLLKVGGAADSFIDVVSCKAILLFKKQNAGSVSPYIRPRYFKIVNNRLPL